MSLPKCPRCPNGQLVTEIDEAYVFAVVSCLQCGHVAEYLHTDGERQVIAPRPTLARLPANGEAA